MTTYNTGNPLGSADPKDLFDNAQNLDKAVNVEGQDKWTDRLGRERLTWDGLTRLSNLGAAVEAAERAEAAADVAEQVADMNTYLTKADADATLPQPEGTIIRVTNDPDPNNNGYWVSDGATWIWSGLQPVSTAQLNEVDGRVDGLEERIDADAYRLAPISRAVIPGYAEATVWSHGDGTASLIHGTTDKGVCEMAQATVRGDLRAPGIPMRAGRIPGYSWVEYGKPELSGLAPLLGYTTDSGAVYKYLFGRGITKLSDPADIQNLDMRVTALEGGGVGVGSGSLGRLGDALDNPLMDVNLTLIGDSITWGRTLAGQVSTPRSHALTDKRDVLTTPSWANLLRNWLGHTFLNVANDTGPTSEDAPGAVNGDGGSGYFSEIRAADARTARHMVLRDSSGTQIARTGSPETDAYTPTPLSIPPGAALEFNIFGPGFDVLYGTASAGGSFEVYVDDVSVAAQSFAGAPSWSNVLNVPTSNAAHSVRIVNQADVAFRLEAIRRTKIVRVVNQGLIGTNTKDWLPTGTLLPNCLRADGNFCFVALGTNDRGLASNISLPSNETAMSSRLPLIVEYLIQHNQDVVLLSNGAVVDDYPWNTGGVERYMSMGDVARINRAVARTYGLSHIDIYTITRELLLNGDTSYLADGLHPGDVGHRDYWFAEIKRRILSAWEAK